MPFSFLLPTTGATALPTTIDCISHPSLPLLATTHRNVLRATLKRFKRLPPSEKAPFIPLVITSLTDYLPYLLALSSSLDARQAKTTGVNAVLRSVPTFCWRPTLGTAGVVKGGLTKGGKAKGYTLDDEVAFVVTALANAHSLLARATLQPLYVTSGMPSSSEARVTAIQAATRSLLTSAAIAKFLASRHSALTSLSSSPRSHGTLDIAPATASALAALAHAEATLLAVLKDDPYPALVNQSRNENDREWMYKAPDIPKVRTLLFARLCLAAAEHAEKAAALLQAAATEMGSKPASDLVKYITGLQKSSRAKACRFFGIDAEMGGQTGTAIGWLNAGLQEMDIDIKQFSKKSLGLGKLKSQWAERREDKRIERETAWGADGGRGEEIRVIEMLHAKWTRTNDNMLAQTVPGVRELLGQMPSGRDIHVVKEWVVPELEGVILEGARAPLDPTEVFAEGESSSDEEEAGAGAGAGSSTGRTVF